MNLSDVRRSLRRAAPATATLLLLASVACKKPEGGPAAGGPTAPAARKGSFAMALTVNPADAQGRRLASVQFDVSAPLADGQLAFELPGDCSVIAGALVRPVKNLGQGKPVSQELSFTCSGAASGVVKAKFMGTDAEGAAMERVAEAAL